MGLTLSEEGPHAVDFFYYESPIEMASFICDQSPPTLEKPSIKYFLYFTTKSPTLTH